MTRLLQYRAIAALFLALPLPALAGEGFLLGQAPLYITVATFLGLGLFLSLTPCVLPMVPILSAFILGSKTSPRHGFLLSLTYVVSMSLTYAALGAVIATLGFGIQGLLQSPAVIIAFSLVFVLLGMAMMGVFQLQLPSALRDKLSAVSARQEGGRFSSVALIGCVSALMVGPCMTAPLAGALIFISETGDYWVGGSALFALGMGMGAPLLLVGLLGPKLLPKPGPWMQWVNTLFGFMLLALAVYFLSRILPPGWSYVGYALVAYGLAIRIYRSFPRPEYTRGVLVIVLASVVLGHAIMKFPDHHRASSASSFVTAFEPLNSISEYETLLRRAQAEGRWVFIDFYADWCVVCQQFERDVLSRSDIQSLLADFILVKPDITQNTQEQQALMRHLRVMGPPTLLFINPKGQEVREMRMAGAPSYQDLRSRLEAIQAQGSK